MTRLRFEGDGVVVEVARDRPSLQAVNGRSFTKDVSDPDPDSSPIPVMTVAGDPPLPYGDVLYRDMEVTRDGGVDQMSFSASSSESILVFLLGGVVREFAVLLKSGDRLGLVMSRVLLLVVLFW